MINSWAGKGNMKTLSRNRAAQDFCSYCSDQKKFTLEKPSCLQGWMLWTFKV